MRIVEILRYNAYNAVTGRFQNNLAIVILKGKLRQNRNWTCFPFDPLQRNYMREWKRTKGKGE